MPHVLSALFTKTNKQTNKKAFKVDDELKWKRRTVKIRHIAFWCAQAIIMPLGITYGRSFQCTNSVNQSFGDTRTWQSVVRVTTLSPPPPSASLFSFSFSFSYHLLTTVHVRYIDLTSSHRIIKVDNDEQCFTGSLHRLTIALSAGFGLTYVTTLSPSTLVSPLTTSFFCKREGWCSSHHYDSSL